MNIIWNTDTERDLETRIVKAKETIAHWESKTPGFWALWQGHTRDEILASWQSQLLVLEYTLTTIQTIKDIFKRG